MTFAQVEEALLNGEILEQYPDTGRGESCLVVGSAGKVPIHAVCCMWLAWGESGTHHRLYSTPAEVH
ncbi:DUF4258 domain-containing protein [Candidatus Bipolaricaulota bacterium]|nr:DUF4258 domain-containing protein [Candidatus Bipolaricaulota bacterium]